MTRTKLCDRKLPTYTIGEERFNMISHIVGGGFGVIALTLSVIFAALSGDPYAVVGCSVYGATMVILYTFSSIYHGLKPPFAKKVMQVLDHCAIYFLIAGTYTPILLTAIRKVSPVTAWTLFGLVWGLAALATTLTAIDLKKYSVFSMVCYIFMGWCILLAPKITMQAIPLPGFLYLLAGGIIYSIGAVLYGLGKTKKYMHAVFHLFVVAGSVLQFLCIYFYII